MADLHAFDANRDLQQVSQKVKVSDKEFCKFVAYDAFMFGDRLTLLPYEI